jgi:4-amino-4-deoxy-L-arabinose transferase-like glycosyltransferase
MSQFGWQHNKVSLSKRYHFFLRLLALLIIVAFFISLIPLAGENVYSSGEDQRDYLKIALWIADGSGFSDGNRHPLYPLLLAPLAIRDISFFTAAKIFSMIIGSLSLGIVFVVSRHIVGEVGGVAVLGLMAWNAEFRRTAAFVNVEVLFVPLFILAWYTAVQALTAISEKTVLWSSLAGFSAGLVYLTKANGILLVLIYGVSLFWLMGPKLIRSSNLWLFIITFLLTALPFWFYNAAQYGNPWFNINTTNYMWLDSWEESYVYEASALPTISTYWRHHSVAQIGERVGNGLLLAAPKQWYGAVRLKAMPETRVAANTAVLAGITIFILIAYKTGQQWQQRRAAFLFTSVGIFLFSSLFAWYHPISDAARFILPWTPVLYLSVIWLVQSWLPRESEPYYARFVLVATTLMVGVILMQNGRYLTQLAQMADRDRTASATAITFMERILQQSEPGDRFLLGPSHAQAEWLAYDRSPLPLPHTPANWPYLYTILVQEDIETILMDAESFTRRQALLQSYWRLDQNGLWAKSLPLGWQLQMPDTHPCDPCLYAFNSQVFVPSTPYQLQYGSVAQLDGYTLGSPNSNQPLYLTTYWHLLSDLVETVHIFMHVVNDQGQIVAQDDGPLAVDLSFYPEQSFPPGTIFRIEHQLPPLMPGQYSVDLGLYEWATQQRVPLVRDGNETGEDYPSLLQIEMGEP